MNQNITIGVNAIVIKKALEYTDWTKALKENDNYQEYYKDYIKFALYEDMRQFIDNKVNINNYIINPTIELIVSVHNYTKNDNILIKYKTECNYNFYNDYKNILKDQLYIIYDKLLYKFYMIEEMFEDVDIWHIGIYY
jgi:hypothetical protein